MAHTDNGSQANKTALVACRVTAAEQRDLKALAEIRRVSLSDLIRNDSIRNLLEEAASLRPATATA